MKMRGFKLIRDSRLYTTVGFCGVLALLVCVTGCPTPTPCADDAACDDGVFCNGAETCVDGVCTAGEAPCAEGETCNEEFDRCDVCVEDADCDDADLCTTDACVDGQCVFTDVVCDGDLVCDPDTGECVDLCEGVDCSDDDLCTDDVCDPATGECSNPDVVCAGDLVCDPDTGECVDLCEGVECDDDDLCTDDVCDPATGDCVFTDVVCDAGFECDPDTGECVALVECETDDDCEALEACVDGVCVEVDECAEDADCDDGLYCNGLETCDVDTGTCVAGDDPCADTLCTCEGEALDPVCEEGDTAAVCSCPPCPAIEFTLGQDTLATMTGSAGADVYNAPLEFNPASGTQVATLQTGDSANGLAGADVLNASFNVSSTVVPTLLADIETINITNFAAGALTLSATNISGVDIINQVSSVGDVAVTGLQELTDCGFSIINDTTVDLALTFAQTATTADAADTFTCTLTDATVGTLTVTTNAANGFETMSFVSNGTTNRLTTLTQTTGTSMATAEFTGVGDLKVDVLPATILTYDAQTMEGGLTLGTGTDDTTYAEFANPTSNLVSITGGSGDDLIIFEDTLATTDFTAGTLDLGDGTDVVQNSFATPFGATSKLRNVEEVRYNATANLVSVMFGGHTGLETITIEEDGTANTFTLSNVPALAGVYPALNYRGDNAQAAQTYDTITYQSSATASEALSITVGNRGTALNATGTTNVHTIGAITANGFGTLNITVADGPATFGGITMTNLDAVTISGSSNVTTGTIAPAATATVSTMNTSGVLGNFNGTFGFVETGATYTGGAGNDTLTFAASSTATATNVGLGDGNNTFVADLDTASVDTITAGSGNDTITGGCGGDTVTLGGGSDEFKMGACTVAEQVADNIIDFTIGEDTITLDEGYIEAADLDTGDVDVVNDWASAPVTTGDAFTIEVITADGATPGSAVDMVVISDTLATFGTAADYITAVTATVDIVGAGVATAGDNFLIAYEDGSDNTRIGVFADDAGAGADSDSFDLGFDIMILSGVNAASLTSATFNVWD
jgi:hypothetical protein